MSNMYNQFATDANKEKTGILIDYGDFRVTVARAGGANKKFGKVLEHHMKPLKRVIDSGMLSDDKAQKLLADSYGQAIVLNWEVLVEQPIAPSDDDPNPGTSQVWQQGIHGPDGNIMEFSHQNVLKVFQDLPDLFADIRDQAGDAANFRKALWDESAKN